VRELSSLRLRSNPKPGKGIHTNEKDYTKQKEGTSLDVIQST